MFSTTWSWSGHFLLCVQSNIRTQFSCLPSDTRTQSISGSNRPQTSSSPLSWLMLAVCLVRITVVLGDRLVGLSCARWIKNRKTVLITGLSIDIQEMKDIRCFHLWFSPWFAINCFAVCLECVVSNELVWADSYMKNVQIWQKTGVGFNFRTIFNCFSFGC